MQWDGNVNAGFTEGNSSWLPVNSNYQSVNVEVGIYVCDKLMVSKYFNVSLLLWLPFRSEHGQQEQTQGGKKSTESSQVLLEKEILAQQGAYFIYIHLSRATTIMMLMG